MAPTALNPNAPSFPPVDFATTPIECMPPTPPPEEDTAFAMADKAHDEAVDTWIDTAYHVDLPDWMLLQESERLKVAAVSLDKMTTRDTWIDRLTILLDHIAPGCTIITATSGDPSSSADKSAWKPFAVRQMPAALSVDSLIEATLSRDSIHNLLRGEPWSPGFFFTPPSQRNPSLPHLTAYWLLDSDIDPYLPNHPGSHGAKLVPFFNSTASAPGQAPTEEDYMNAPVFVAKNHTCGYKYLGHYSQTRFSDRLDYERMVDGTVPAFVLDVWAKTLTSQYCEDWMRDALREHVWPKPTYQGPLPIDVGTESSASAQATGSPTKNGGREHERRVKRATESYIEQLRQWETESRDKLARLTEKDIHDLFCAADAAEVPALRLWWEYLQCTKYDKDFLNTLLAMEAKAEEKREKEAVLRAKKALGWYEQLVDVVSGSGHTYQRMELRPPPTRNVRKDSVTGRDEGVAPPSRGRSPVRAGSRAPGPQKPAQPATTKASTPAPHNGMTAPPTGKTEALPSSKAVPPHLRGRASQAEASTTVSSTTPIASATHSTAPNTTVPSQASNASPPKKVVPPHLRSRANKPETATTHATSKPASSTGTPSKTEGISQPVSKAKVMPFITGDLKAAKEMRDSFSFGKARARR